MGVSPIIHFSPPKGPTPFRCQKDRTSYDAIYWIEYTIHMVLTKQSSTEHHMVKLSIMDTSLGESILQAFKECQQGTQQFIVDDSVGSVDLSCATTKELPQTPDNAKNQPLLYPHCSVYRFDPIMFRGKESFLALVLMIQSSLIGSKFSFVQGSRNNRFVLWCSHTRVQEKKQTHMHLIMIILQGSEARAY